MRVDRRTMRSRAFGAERGVVVITPDDYARRRRRYPVLYLHDGSHDWLERGDLLGAVDEADCPAFLLVLPEPVDRTREYKLSPAHLEFLADEVVTWTDAHFRTRPCADSRAVHGVSLGGLSAVALGLRRPEVFGAAGSQGGAFWYWKRRLVREAATRKGCPTRFHLACGRQDGNLSDNRAMREAMQRSGLSYVYEEVHGRHSWPCWRRSLPLALRFYFCSGR